jgi:hypothetical protein
MRQSIWWFGLSMLILSFTWRSEDPSSAKIIERLAKYYQILPQEKAYLHLDKPYYHPGDTIWFKAYLTNATNHLPDSASKVIYVDLIRPSEGKIVLREMLRVDNGFTHGNIDLADTLPEGNYQLRAYTNWMRNFSESQFFTRDFRLYKDIDRSYSEDRLAKLSTITDVQFFPEGGDWVNGLDGRVGFKAVNIAGNGIDAKGFIVNSKQDTVTTFKSGHLGMGYFMFKPSPEETYTAYVKDPRGNLRSYNLPKRLNHGFVMALDNITRKDEIRVYVSHNFPAKKNITLLVHQQGQVCYAADIKDSPGAFQLRIPRQNFPQDGIAHFTLFDEAGVPRCERLAYIDKGQPLRVDIKTNKPAYGPREKVEVQLTVEDYMGVPVRGNFSVSVTDNNQVIHEPFGENIRSYFLLSSDVGPAGQKPSSEVRGFIQQPDYYFDKKNPQASADLDVLLMTQGWRRFLWDDVLNKNTYDTTFVIETGLHLSGKVTQRNGQPSKQPVSITFMLASPFGNSGFAVGTAKPDGSFSIENLEFSGITTIAAQANKDKKLIFKFDSLPALPRVSVSKQQIETMWMENSVLSNYLIRERQAAELQLTQNRLLKEVTIVGQKYQAPDSRRNILPSALKGNALTIDAHLCAGAYNAFQLLQAKIAGVKIYQDDNGFHALLRGVMSFGMTGTSEPLYLVDGIPVDGSYINSLIPCDVESIEVFKGPVAIYGTRGGQGVIAFYTRKNSLLNDASDTGSSLARLKRAGYFAPREFYSPRHEQADSIPDHRSTIFWAPEVKTDINGKATLIFWNTDETNTDVKVLLEGMGFNGKFAVASRTYSIQ